MRLFLLVFSMLFSLSVVAAEEFVSFAKGDVCLTNSHGKIVCDAKDWQSVLRAVEDLKEDLRRVTGRCDYPVTVGTLGHSRAIDNFAKKNKWLTEELKGIKKQ